MLAARLVLPTDRYDHAVLGDAIEWAGLEVTTAAGTRRFVLPQAEVFEDVEARLVDSDGDGAAEVMVVVSHQTQGARLTLWDGTGVVAASAPIGQRHRWLAPVGAADLDADGQVDLVWVDRPHLVRDLVFARREGARIVETGRVPGLTNHRIGDPTIAGGLRDCGAGPEVVVADAGWRQAMAVRPGAAPRPLGPLAGMAGYLACAKGSSG